MLISGTCNHKSIASLFLRASLTNYLFFFFTLAVFCQEKNQITYIANEGIFIEYEGKKVLIDALHKKKDRFYQHTKRPYPALIIDGSTPFEQIDLFLVTHVHDDHFDKDYMISFLEHHEESALIAPQQVLDTLGNVPYLEAQIYSLKGADRGLMYEMDGISVTTIPLNHSYPKKNYWIENMAYLIDIEGVQFLHIGDAELTQENFKRIQKVTGGKVDYALFPYWLFYDEGLNWINKKIKAKKFIAIHVPKHKTWTLESILKKKIKNLNVFMKVGEVEVIGSN